MPLPTIKPLAPELIKAPFDHDDCLFEIKYDGFRGLAYCEGNKGKLVSRNEFDLNRFSTLAGQIANTVDAENAILDGEIVVIGEDGHPQFYDLMFSRGTPVFAVFDVLHLDGEDLRDLPLWERKSLLEGCLVMPSPHVLYVSPIEGEGIALYEKICEMDMEGIVCKPNISPYKEVGGRTTWLKVKNPSYSQAEGRGELFNKRR